MNDKPLQILQVALPVPLRKTFEYLPPNADNSGELSDLVPKIGQRVLVPFGRQTLIGVIVNISSESEFAIEKVKPAMALLDLSPTFDSHMMTVLNWSANYYQHPIGEVLSAALPGQLREPKNMEASLPKTLMATDALPELARLPKNASQMRKLHTLLSMPVTKAELSDNNVTSSTIKKFVEQGWACWTTVNPEIQKVLPEQLKPGLQLNTEQAVALSTINQAQGALYFLLDGVTGSGKTEVYLQAIGQHLLEQKQVLVLVPEIGLTPQTISRFEQRFNVPIALWHSGMSNKQRLETWFNARSGQAKIVIATRSGIFLPFESLSLIVIDEEHDASFKQQDGFKYHSRSLALYRAQLLQIPVVLGSATPSLESLNNAQSGKFHHLILRQRAAGSQLPSMHLLDLNRCQVQAGLGEPLVMEMSQALAQQQQVMLFINRRGFAPVLMCEECHWLTECHRCSSYMTYHRQSNRLICHHCGNQHQTVRQCGGCGSTRIVPVGMGTEQLEQSLTTQFPDYPVLRLDRDSTSKKGEFERLLEQIHQGTPQIIIGTQMIAKGHHFPNVSLVGIVDVDGALFSSDFRASEKLAQLIVQVSGRAGRGSLKGQVWLQTKFPEHPVIQDLVNNQYQDFAKFALSERKMMTLPPYSHHIVLRAESSFPTLGGDWLMALMPHLNHFNNLLCLGPTPAPMMKKAGKFRFMLTLQCQSRPYLHKVVDWLIENLDTIQKDNRIRWSIDVDPTELS